jgi:hypothetical protein
MIADHQYDPHQPKPVDLLVAFSSLSTESKLLTLGIYILESLFAFRALVQTFFSEDIGHIIHMQAITHTGKVIRGLNNSDVAVAVVTPWCSTVENAERYNLSTLQLHDLVAVLCLTSFAP